MTLSEFVNTFACKEYLDYFEDHHSNQHIVDANDIVESLENDDALFNKYGVLYAMRDRLFLLPASFVQEYVEYLYNFAMTNPHAVKDSFLYPYTINKDCDQSDPTVKFKNPYYRNYETIVTPDQAINYYSDVMNTRIIENYFDNPSVLIEKIDKISKKYSGISNPVFSHIVDSAIKKDRLKNGEEININASDICDNNSREKHRAIKSIINNIDNEVVTHIAENLLCMFNIKELHNQRNRLVDFVFMTANHDGYENIFISWDDFTAWCNLNKESLHNILNYKQAMETNKLNSTKIISKLTNRDVSLYMILKDQILNYDNAMIRAGMCQEEINKNYNRQKLYKSIDSIIRVCIGDEDYD